MTIEVIAKIKLAERSKNTDEAAAILNSGVLQKALCDLSGTGLHRKTLCTSLKNTEGQEVGELIISLRPRYCGLMGPLRN
jgi:hypothetical protein